jgi:K(+)-stimulated pyrophosphate-energized sodium pump
MIAPGLLVILSPLLVGWLFGIKCLAGMLAGALVSGVVLAISSANSGGAWDNAKKYIEAAGKKGTDLHKAAVVGDTVGDPFKDTSGPAINILIKLMAIISLVFVEFFVTHGGLLTK